MMKLQSATTTVVCCRNCRVAVHTQPSFVLMSETAADQQHWTSHALLVRLSLYNSVSIVAHVRQSSSINMSAVWRV